MHICSTRGIWVNSLVSWRCGSNFECNFLMHATDSVEQFLWNCSQWNCSQSSECHDIILWINQHWFRLWLGAIRQHAITWANVDPACHHVVSLSHNDSTGAVFIVYTPTFNRKDKSDVKCQNTLGCLDQYACNVMRLWNSRVYKYAQRMETMKQSGLWSSLGAHGSLVVICWLCISRSGETRKFDFLNQIWPWRSRSIAIQNNRDLNQAIFHLWSKFGDPSLNG